jgi:hypothetical protein
MMAKLKLTAKRIRNLTTGILHTCMDDVYRDLAAIVGVDGLMTHQLPRVRECVLPWLREKTKNDAAFWDKDIQIETDWEIDHWSEPSQAERAVMLENYKAMPDPLAGKAVIEVHV